MISGFLKDQKSQNPWLEDSPSQVLQQSIIHLNRAYQSFFKKTSGFPKFKSRYSKQSIALPQSVKVDFKNHKISIPKIKWINSYVHRTFSGKSFLVYDFLFVLQELCYR